MNATRAMYPLSSKIEKNKKSNKICGKNDSTENTPPSTPSPMNPTTHSGAPAIVNPSDTAVWINPINVSNVLNKITPGAYILSSYPKNVCTFTSATYSSMELMNSTSSNLPSSSTTKSTLYPAAL